MNDMSIEVPPPGFFIKEELDARGWSQSDLAYILGMSVQQVNPILSGKRAVSTEMAKALGEAFDVAPEFFSNMQTSYDHYKAASPDPAIAKRARLQESFPVREMIKREWFQDVGDVTLLEGQFLRFFSKKNIEAIPFLSHAAKKTSYSEKVSPSQFAWLYRVHQIAADLQVGSYSRAKLQKLVDSELPSLMIAPEEIRYVPELLASCGVRIVFVEKLPQAKIDGVCFWERSKPVIGMSLRHDRIDNFWFVLRHELEHVLQGHAKREEIIDDLDGENSSETADIPEEERVANSAAGEFCVSRAQLKSFIARKHPYISEKDVLGFARRLGVHPGIAVGQINNYRQEHAFLRKHLVKIRGYILPYAPSDGWGDVFPVEL
ncbi:MAG: helix-turn-helix domain-containing protein [Pseudomonadota bacterium]